MNNRPLFLTSISSFIIVIIIAIFTSCNYSDAGVPATGSWNGNEASPWPPGNVAVGSLFVASLNTSQQEKDSADYVCDGVDDDVEIQSAIDDLYNGDGGLVRLSKGTFHCRNMILKSDPYGINKRVDIKGMGAVSTNVSLQSGSNCDVFDGDGSVPYVTCMLRDLSINGNSANQTSGNGIDITGVRLTLENVSIAYCWGKGIYGNGAIRQGGLWAYNVHIGCCPYGIYLESYYGVHLNDVSIEGYSPPFSDFYKYGYYHSGGELFASNLVIDGAFDQCLRLYSMTNGLISNFYVAQNRGAGVCLIATSHVSMAGGIVYLDSGDYKTGFWFYLSNNNNVISTTIYKGATGSGQKYIILDTSNNNTFALNQLQIGLGLTDNGSGNIIEYNNTFS